MNANFEGLRALNIEELELVSGGVAPSRTGGCIPKKGPKYPDPIDPTTGTGPTYPVPTTTTAY
jgi:hypothetical protein